MRKSFELMNREEQHTFAWKIMRCIETNVPRKISTISNIFTLMQGTLDLPQLEDTEMPQITQEQATAAITTTLAISNLSKILYSSDAVKKGDESIVDKLIQVFDEENVSTKNFPITLLRVTEFLCQEFLCDGCKAN